MWILSEILVGQCFWHCGQTNPSVWRWRASTCTWTTEARLEVKSHSVQANWQSSLRYTRFFNSLSDIFKGKYTFYLFISSMLITSAMNNKGIFSFTKFLTNLAIISQWGYMVNLNMIPYICKVLALVSTVCALPFTTKNIFHCFGVHQHFHIL